MFLWKIIIIKLNCNCAALKFLRLISVQVSWGHLRSQYGKFKAKTFPSRPRPSQVCDERSRDQEKDFWQKCQDQEQNIHKLNSSDLEDQDLNLMITRPTLTAKILLEVSYLRLLGD